MLLGVRRTCSSPLAMELSEVLAASTNGSTRTYGRHSPR